MEYSSNCVFEVYLSKEQAITRIGFRPGFPPKALNWGKAIKIQPPHSTCRTVHLRFKPQLRYLFWTLFQVSNLAALAKSPNTGALQSQRSSFSEWTVAEHTTLCALERSGATLFMRSGFSGQHRTYNYGNRKVWNNCNSARFYKIRTGMPWQNVWRSRSKTQIFEIYSGFLILNSAQIRLSKASGPVSDEWTVDRYFSHVLQSMHS